MIFVRIIIFLEKSYKSEKSYRGEIYVNIKPINKNAK